MQKQLVVLVIIASVVLSACGSNTAGNGTVEQGMIDVIQKYTYSIYEVNLDQLAASVCKQDVDSAVAAMKGPSAVPPSTINNLADYDMSKIKFSVVKRNGDVVKLNVDSGGVSIKLGTITQDNMPIPRSANGIILKNEDGWKVCYGAAI